MIPAEMQLSHHFSSMSAQTEEIAVYLQDSLSQKAMQAKMLQFCSNEELLAVPPRSEVVCKNLFTILYSESDNFH